MIPSMKIRRFLIAITSALLAAGCLFQSDKRTDRGTMVDNEVLAGKVILADGEPAINARIRIFPVNHIPDSLATLDPSSTREFTTRTDSNGIYRVSIEHKGEYNILGELQGKFSYLDSVYLTDSTRGIPTDTLDLPGSIIGFVGLQPNHDPRTVTVQVLGTNIYSNVETGGRFWIPNLAKGRYSVRILSTLSEYTSLFISLQVRTGVINSIKDTLWLPYTGIPVVTGVKTSYDTLRAVARLSWTPVEYGYLEEYAVYRDAEPFRVVSKIPRGRIKETVFYDSLGISQYDTNDYAFKYRVVAVHKSGREGEPFGSTKLIAASLRKIKANVNLEIRRSVWNPESKTDSVDVVATMIDRTRRLVEISWDVGNGKVHPAPRKLPGEFTGMDSLRFSWSYPGPYQVYTRVTDDAGTVWFDSLRVPGNSTPLIAGIPDSVVKAFDSYSFKPMASDPDLDGLKFSITNLPKWGRFDTATGALTGVPENQDSGIYRNILISVRDDRRSVSLPAFNIRVNSTPWKIVSTRDFPNGFPIATSLRDSVYFFSSVTEMYDPKSNLFLQKGLNPARKSVISVHLYNGKILAFSSGWSYGYPVEANLFDPATNTWELHSKSTILRSEFAALEWQGKFYVVGGSLNSDGSAAVEEYDPVADKWTLLKLPPHQIVSPAGYAAKDGLWFFNKLYPDSIMVYHPEIGTWEMKTGPNTPENAKLCTAAGKLYSVVPENGDFFGVRLHEFDFAANTWKALTPYRFGRYLGGFQMACAESNGKFYFLLDTGGRKVDMFQYDPLFEKIH